MKSSGEWNKSFQSVDWLILIYIFLLALVIRTIFAWPAITGEQGFAMGDDDDYYRLAISLLETGQLRDGNFAAYRMPLFPIILAGIYKVFGSEPHVAHPFIVLLSATTCGGVYILGKKTFSRQVGLAAGIFSIVDLNLIFYSRFLLTETLFVFLILYSFIALIKLDEKQNWHWALISGLLLGLGALTRVNLLIFIPVLMGWMIIAQRPIEISRLRNALIVGGSVLIMWSVWVSRNYFELGTFVPLTTQGGRAYYGVFNDDAAKYKNLSSYGSWRTKDVPELPEEEWSEINYDRWQKRLAWNWIRSNPFQAILVALSQVVHLWKPDFWLIYVLDISLLLLPAGVVGLLLALRSNNLLPIPWVLFAATLTITSVFTIAVPRFRLVLHPYILILAANTIVHIAALINRSISNKTAGQISNY